MINNDERTQPLMTHREIAKVMGISACRVYQLEQSAFAKIRACFAWDAARRGDTLAEYIESSYVEHDR